MLKVFTIEKFCVSKGKVWETKPEEDKRLKPRAPAEEERSNFTLDFCAGDYLSLFLRFFGSIAEQSSFDLE